MAKITAEEQKRIDRERRIQERQPHLQPDQWIRQPDGTMKPAPVGPSIMDV